MSLQLFPGDPLMCSPKEGLSSRVLALLRHYLKSHLIYQTIAFHVLGGEELAPPSLGSLTCKD